MLIFLSSDLNRHNFVWLFIDAQPRCIISLSQTFKLVISSLQSRVIQSHGIKCIQTCTHIPACYICRKIHKVGYRFNQKL